jgi:hypothetical protein
VNGAEPTVLWRLFKKATGHARAVLLPGGPPYTLAFFTHEAMDRVENYDAMDLALFRAEEIKRSLIGDGWSES